MMGQSQNDGDEIKWRGQHRGHIEVISSNTMIYNPCVAETPILDLSLSNTS